MWLLRLSQQTDYINKIADLASANKLPIDKIDYSQANKLVDLFGKFTASSWNQLKEVFPALEGVITETSSKFLHINSFLGGMNLTEAPGFKFSIALIIPILAGLTQWLSVKTMNTAPQDPDAPGAGAMKSMNTVMPIMSVFFCITFPIGIGIYWVASSTARMVLQIGINQYMKKIDVDDMIKENIEKKNKKRAKKGLPPINANATIQSANKAAVAAERKKALEEERAAKAKTNSTDYYKEKRENMGTIASRARMVQDYDEKKGKKKIREVTVMGDYIEVSAKTVEDAVTKALIQLETTSDKMEYVVVEKGSTGILGIFNSKPAIIKARKVLTVTDMAEEFLKDVFAAMNMEVTMTSSMDEEEKCLNIDLAGADMGVLIGKRGQTLDSLQYLVSLIINKESEEYLRVKLDTENYRERRKATLESLARNIASKVKRTKRPVSLEPMNPYERRIIHSALQNDKYVVTRSEGDEPYRHVIVSLKKESRGRYDNNRYDRPSRPYRERREYHRSEQ